MVVDFENARHQEEEEQPIPWVDNTEMEETEVFPTPRTAAFKLDNIIVSSIYI
jgi:hypothetical protein